jgi:trk system potassium uptake protein TrkA
MRLIVVGGGKLGYNLLKKLIKDNHKVTLIDKDKKVCDTIVENMNVNVILGDGSDLQTLKEAGIGKADVIVAVTGSDECNFVICETVKTIYSDKKTIACVNNPDNIEAFKLLGIDEVFCGAEEISRLIKS